MLRIISKTVGSPSQNALNSDLKCPGFVPFVAQNYPGHPGLENYKCANNKAISIVRGKSMLYELILEFREKHIVMIS